MYSIKLIGNNFPNKSESKQFCLSHIDLFNSMIVSNSTVDTLYIMYSTEMKELIINRKTRSSKNSKKFYYDKIGCVCYTNVIAHTYDVLTGIGSLCPVTNNCDFIKNDQIQKESQGTGESHNFYKSYVLMLYKMSLKPNLFNVLNEIPASVEDLCENTELTNSEINMSLRQLERYNLISIDEGNDEVLCGENYDLFFIVANRFSAHIETNLDIFK